MTVLPTAQVADLSLDGLVAFEGRVVVLVPESGKLDQSARRVNRLTRGALERFVESSDFSSLKGGEARDLAFPTGMHASAVQVVKLDRRPDAQDHAGNLIAVTSAVPGEGKTFVSINLAISIAAELDRNVLLVDG